MEKTKIIVLGASGMLGSMLVDVLSREADWQVIATVRSENLAERGRQLMPQAESRLFRGGGGKRDGAAVACLGGSTLVHQCHRPD